ncbi:MAG: hypothetical protein D4R50_02475 [Actinomycetales bacterium]|nr:MAG: hypothetical protein D4R50_02475 [Actinomycetales bacterium]
MRRIALLVSVALVLGSPSASASSLSQSAIPRVFTSLALAPEMADPSIILIDRSNGEVVYEYNSESMRKPASVMKIFSAAAALEYIDPQKRFITTLSLGVKPGSVVFNGELDPWIATSRKSAIADHRAWIGYLAGKAISAIKEQSGKPVQKIAIKYSGLYAEDVIELRKYFRAKGVITGAIAVAAGEIAQITGEEIVSTRSPTLATMVGFALMWSDNLLAERLARLASQSAGNPLNDDGVSTTFHTLLDSLGIEHSDLRVHDGSGLSKANRVTAKMLGDLLFKLRNDPKFTALYDGLPVGGVSGTLVDRFLKTAPEAVGLIRAKTGTLNGTVSLAGYVDSTDRQYVFVVIADQIPKTYAGAAKARATLDRTLAKIASPIIESAPVVPIEDTTTAMSAA